MNKKLLYLFKNTGLLMLSNFSSKILVFFMVPLYTSVLTTEEYGSYDLLYSTILMLSPILTANIADGVMRFSIGAEQADQKRTFQIGLKYIVLSVLLMLAGSWFVAEVMGYELLKQYFVPFNLFFAVTVIQQLFSQFSRGIDNVKGLSISGVIGTVTMVACNVYFLLVAKLGLVGYFYANILAQLIPSVFMFFHGKMHRYLSPVDKAEGNLQIESQTLRYCVPLIMTGLSWNINNLSSRYVVTWICGMTANGLYSVAYKIPAILNAVQGVFIQAWQLSAIREFDPEDEDRFFSNTYQGTHTVMVLLCSGLIMMTRVAAYILFAKDFYVAWEFVPTLLLYIVFNTLAGTLGGVFSAVKDAKALTVSAVAGAIVSIVLNVAFVPFMGAEGAAVATVISSIVIWGMRMRDAGRHIKLHIQLRQHIAEYAILCIQAAAMTLVTAPIGYVAQAILFIVLVVINFGTVRKLLLKK